MEKVVQLNERNIMSKWRVSATGTTEYYLDVEAESEDEALEQVQYLTSENWLSDSYSFDVNYAEVIE